ncbi:hypothetical protein P280DRAFT_31616 [Massarina eburnea CBS 473.64]|uniref:Uncharacterized protein n=1 Tax=Massarina eburnea CBS 473.64 TaxID=1395130 RepID=A0A6A6RXF4_9PLEO|nr:hypothetical protein P280DRAFT_31616 [Massarina eburnea CBS 473.64]
MVLSQGNRPFFFPSSVRFTSSLRRCDLHGRKAGDIFVCLRSIPLFAHVLFSLVLSSLHFFVHCTLYHCFVIRHLGGVLGMDRQGLHMIPEAFTKPVDSCGPFVSYESWPRFLFHGHWDTSHLYTNLSNFLNLFVYVVTPNNESKMHQVHDMSLDGFVIRVPSPRGTRSTRSTPHTPTQHQLRHGRRRERVGPI